MPFELVHFRESEQVIKKKKGNDEGNHEHASIHR